MSVSTGCFCSCSACALEVRKASEVSQIGWKNELEDRILEFPGTTDDFINTLLPCSTPWTLDDDLSMAFSKYATGQESQQYMNLVAGFTKLVSKFPDDKKLTIADTHGPRIHFPFHAFADHHHDTAPDLSISFPGQPLVTPNWQHIAMVVEAKGKDSDDPFSKKAFHTHVETVTQLAKSARNIMIAHGALATFVIGIYGNTVRLARFDHSCALVSPAFKLKTAEGKRVLQKYLWHFAHPAVGGSVVGSDPTLRKFDPADRAWVKAELERAGAKDWQKHVLEIEKGRRVEVYDEQTGRCVPYLLYHLVDVNPRLFSRGTMVWRAIEDTRVWDGHRLVADPTHNTPTKPRIVKEAWRQLVRTAEAKFYQRLNDRITDDDRFGFAKMVCGGDIGEFELRWWKETARRREAGLATVNDDRASSPGTPSPPPAFPLFSSIGSSPLPLGEDVSNPSQYIPHDDFPLSYSQHQTYSWRLIFGDEWWYMDRSHMRIVIDDVGRPLTEFTSSHELVQAIHDAIKGHKQAWEEARILHRDVSVGNILIVDDPAESRFAGFLHDCDYSSMEPDPKERQVDTSFKSSDQSTGEIAQPSTGNPEDVAKQKERTGTFYFMAYEILFDPGTIHNIHHDLESFYWVLLWVVVRHINHGDRRKDALCEKIFKYGDDEECSGAKMLWLFNGNLDIPNNKPLTYLLTEFSAMVLAGVPRRQSQQTPLDYEKILRLFDDALHMQDWPENDWQECTLLKGEDRSNVKPLIKKPTDGSAIDSVPAQASQPLPGSMPPALPSQLPRPAATHAGRFINTTGSKRPFPPIPEEASGPVSEPSKSRSKRRRVDSTMGPPALPTSETSAGPAARTRSGSRAAKNRSQSRQGTRSSSRQREMREKMASGGRAS